MDRIIAAVIGAVATLVGVFINHYLRRRATQPRIPPTSRSSGVWGQPVLSCLLRLCAEHHASGRLWTDVVPGLSIFEKAALRDSIYLLGIRSVSSDPALAVEYGLLATRGN